MPTPAPEAPSTTSASYPGRAEQVRAVRADLRELLGDCPIADDILLCASELATNAAIHSNSRLPGGTFTVRADIRPDDHARIEVEDAGGPWTPGPADPLRGHGLDIVRTLATGWGIAGDQERRTIWARFDWPAPASADAAGNGNARRLHEAGCWRPGLPSPLTAPR